MPKYKSRSLQSCIVIATLLYGCESWTTYRKHVCSLDQFHMRCLRRIARIKRQDKTSNTEVLRRCEISGIEAFIIKAQLRWVGHVPKNVRLQDSKGHLLRRAAVGHKAQLSPTAAFQRQL